MKKFRGVFTCLLLVLPAVLATKPAAAQSPNAQAMTWFRNGLNEQSLEKKIQAYQKAIELDPSFVEALYNLGLAYKQQQDYRRAAQYFLQAYRAKPGQTKTESQVQILYELAMAYKKLGRARDYEETARAIKGLNADAAIRANLALETGRFLGEQGRYDEALVELRAGQQLSAVKSSEFAGLIRQVESDKELQPLYDSARKAKAGGDANQARVLLEQIRVKNPAYKDVAAQLAELEAKLATETKKQAYAALYEQAQKYISEGKLELAIATYESLVQQAGIYKDARTKLQEARQQLEEKQLNERLESEYANGIAALKGRNWARAILAFEKILEDDRSFRDARRRLAEAQNGLDRESTATVVARYYTEGLSAMGQNDFGAALAALEKVRKLSPNYRDTENLLADVENALRATAAPPASLLAPSVNVDSLYQEALAAFEKEDWTQAVVSFEKIQLLQPGYLDADDRLTKARQHIGAAENTAAAVALQREAGGNFSIYIVLAALVVLPLLGFLIFSPELHAQLHLLRGNYTAAAQIYEKTLARQPKKVKLYPALANIYLLLGRSDENAIKVYKTILQLNLNTHNRDEISTIVAQNYLTEGRTDSDAIEVLESALKAEQRRQQHAQSL